MANLITGDAITLDLRIAGLASRSLALLVDVAIQGGLLMTGVVLTNWVFAAGGSPGAQAAATIVVVVLALVGWPTMVETVTRGRSAGKAMMGLRVVRDDGGPVRMRHSLVRALAMVFLDLWVTSGVVGGLSALASSMSKRMGDHLAGTLVVGERMPRSAVARGAEIRMPPQLAGWAAALDLVAVPDGLVLNVRTFLHRAGSLEPSVRVTTAARLATQLAAHVRTPAPAGTPAEAYLAAVLAERTRRAGWAGPAAGWAGPAAGWSRAVPGPGDAQPALGGPTPYRPSIAPPAAQPSANQPLGASPDPSDRTPGTPAGPAPAPTGFAPPG